MAAKRVIKSVVSFIEYECEIAAKAYRDGEMKVVVLYGAASVRRSKCPEAVAYIGTHIPMEYKGQDGKTYWNYQEIKKAIMG